VLPLQNMSQNKSQDFLRVALADEITNILTYTPSLQVRPISASQKYADATDVAKAGAELKVAVLVTGHYLREHDKLMVTLEAIEVRRDRLLWRGTFSVPATDMLRMQQQLAAEVRQGLVPVLGGASSGLPDTATRPRNAEAYDFYLRSAAVPHDPGPNQEAIAMLERSVGLDPQYAPAWDALGLRYYYDATYGSGGQAVFDRATAAYARAVALDRDYLPAAAHLVRSDVERGNLVPAYQQATALVQRRSDSAQAHFTLSYVLRYAGLLTDAARECDTALALDPSYYGLRSCALVYAELGQGGKALEFIRLDTGSEWSTNLLPVVELREGDIAAARGSASRMRDDPIWFGGVVQACLRPGAAVDMEVLDARVNAARRAMLAQRDPEFRYLQGSFLTFCGERQFATELLRSAIAQNYCATEALQHDPLLDKLRPYPEFETLQALSRQCQSSFLKSAGRH
jgi:TolB-like protein